MDYRSITTAIFGSRSQISAYNGTSTIGLLCRFLKLRARMCKDRDTLYNVFTNHGALYMATTTMTIPIESTADGVLRVGGTRGTLDTVVTAFLQGATAEEIVLRYPSLKLADVYAVITYYLHNQSEVEAYLQQRQQRAELVRAQNEERFPPDGIRARLLARRASHTS
jgi:uncharacterized protein (DUF433 family)